MLASCYPKQHCHVCGQRGGHRHFSCGEDPQVSLCDREGSKSLETVIQPPHHRLRGKSGSSGWPGQPGKESWSTEMGKTMVSIELKICVKNNDNNDVILFQLLKPLNNYCEI